MENKPFESLNALYYCTKCQFYTPRTNPRCISCKYPLPLEEYREPPAGIEKKGKRKKDEK
jgi:predicted ATP-dependent serine protease